MEPVSLVLTRHLQWLQHLPRGWHGLFRELAERLAREHPQARITHAGAKLARLQLITDGGNDETRALIMEAWHASAHMCEECGAEGRLLVDRGGWGRTLCPSHSAGFRAPPRRKL